MDPKTKRKRVTNKIVKEIINTVYSKPEHVPKTKEDIVKNIYDFAIIKKLVRRILVRRDR